MVPTANTFSEDDLPDTGWPVIQIALCSFFAVGFFVGIFHVPADNAGLLSTPGLVLLLMTIVLVVVIARLIVLRWGKKVTKQEVRELDLWRGERLLLVGVLLLVTVGVIVQQALGLEGIGSSAVATFFGVFSALVLVAPLNDWFGRSFGALDRLREAESRRTSEVLNEPMPMVIEAPPVEKRRSGQAVGVVAGVAATVLAGWAARRL